MQERRNSIANALELRLSCTKLTNPSISNLTAAGYCYLYPEKLWFTLGGFTIIIADICSVPFVFH